MRHRVLGGCAVVLLAWGLDSVPAVAGGGGGCYQATEGTGTVVEMRDACFTPSVLHVDAGATVTFVNRDGFEHAVNGINWGDTGMLAGAELAQAFPASGTFAYACYLHPGMTGVVVVGDGTGSGPVVDVPVPEPVAAVAAPAPAPAEEEPSSSTSVAVGVGAGILGLGLGAVGGRRLRRQ